jgi:hypothetical protein
MRLFNILAIAGTVVVTAAAVPQTANADRVCRQECVGPVCQERCFEDSDRRGEREGAERRENREGMQRHEERDRGPGIDLRVPGVRIDVGR